MKLTVLLAVVTLSGFASSVAQETKQPDAPVAKAGAKIIQVTAEEAEKQIAAGVTVIDLRTADEFEHKHIKGAKNISSIDSDFEKNIAELDPKKPVLVHCQSGRRSSTAIREVLSKSKLQTIYHMGGGLTEWIKAGKPVETTPTPIESKILPERLR